MRLAILIIGLQNSGKTSTIRHLINTYTPKSLSVMRAGWNNIFLNKTFRLLRLNAYCVPASPTETGIDLSERFEEWDSIPQVLIVAEQLKGVKYNNTLDFLKLHGYIVLRYDIDNTVGSSDWQRFDKSTELLKLNNRATEIIDDIKKFLKTNGIV